MGISKLKANATYMENDKPYSIVRILIHSPGSRRESLSRNINAKSGKWFRHASDVSNIALSTMMVILANAKAK